MKKKKKPDTPVETTLISAFVYLMPCKKGGRRKRSRTSYNGKKFFYFFY